MFTDDYILIMFGLLQAAMNVLEIDGKFKSQYETSEAALKAGLELKTKYPQIQVKIYDAKARTRSAIELTEKSFALA